MSSPIRTLERSLLLKLSAWLVALAALLLYSHHTVIGVIRGGQQEAEIINAAGRQRMLAQQFVRQANLALIGLSIADWNTLLEQRKLSAETSTQFEETMHALLHGGKTRLGTSSVILPRVETPDVRASLEEVAVVWAEVKRASVKVLRSENSQLRNHPDLALMQSATTRLVARVDDTLLLMQRRGSQRSDQLVRYQSMILLGGLGIFVFLAIFVHRSIISPLAETIGKLDHANFAEGERTRDLSRKNEELQAEVAERQRAQQQLAEKELRLRSILESEPECVKLVAADGTLLEMNPAGLKIIEADGLEKVIGQSVYAMIAPEHHAVFRAVNEGVFQGESRIAEFEIIGLKGTRRWMQTHACPLRDTEGRILALLAVTRDVTERRRVEAELAYERDLLRTLLENSPDQIYFKDRESRFIKCSNALAARFQLPSADDLVGTREFDYFTEGHARPAFEDEQEIMRTGQPIVGKVEKEHWKEEGKVTWVLSTKVPLRDKTGEIIGTFGISKDITAIKEAEANLALVHTQLLDTSRQAGMAEVAISVLHNVGNVLNSVNVASTCVADGLRKSRGASLKRVVALLREHEADLGGFFTSDPRGKQLPGFLAQLADQLSCERAAALTELAQLQKNIEHIKNIVAMQQNYAKVSGVTETVQITDLIEDTLRMNAEYFANHDLRVVRDFADVPPVTVEKHKVLQILINLVRNAKHACDAKPQPDKTLTLRVFNGGGIVKVAVSDNGIGIAPEYLARIFNHGCTTKKDGHGFGLHSGALAAKDLGGALRVESKGVGEGATFTLELPATPSNHHV